MTVAVVDISTIIPDILTNILNIHIYILTKLFFKGKFPSHPNGFFVAYFSKTRVQSSLWSLSKANKKSHLTHVHVGHIRM